MCVHELFSGVSASVFFSTSPASSWTSGLQDLLLLQVDVCVNENLHGCGRLEDTHDGLVRSSGQIDVGHTGPGLCIGVFLAVTTNYRYHRVSWQPLTRIRIEIQRRMMNTCPLFLNFLFFLKDLTTKTTDPHVYHITVLCHIEHLLQRGVPGFDGLVWNKKPT